MKRAEIEIQKVEREISEREVELHRLEREKVRCTSHHRAMEERLGRNYMVKIVKKYESNGNIILYLASILHEEHLNLNLA